MSRSPTPLVIFGFGNYFCFPQITGNGSDGWIILNNIKRGAFMKPRPPRLGYGQRHSSSEWNPAKWQRERKCSIRVGPHSNTSMSWRSTGKPDRCGTPLHPPTEGASCHSLTWRVGGFVWDTRTSPGSVTTWSRSCKVHKAQGTE